MWVVLFVSIHLLLGPDVTVVSDYGPYKARDACEQDLESVRSLLTPEEQQAFRSGELRIICVKVSDYRGLTAPGPEGN
ncbi:hypothetical protein [Chthonobacter albigriseus]|uniref:hypothetical protein n=1 Tax=Chthonobacter albigriseus TaxID=1683161 RepID=UPI0015EFA040|nr:hypothetical protein [Chthonobacter albigriseus]